MRKILTFLCAALMSVGMWADPIVVEWNSSDLPESDVSFSKDGVTLNCDEIDDGTLWGPGTFTTTLGNFTKIEITTGWSDISGAGWSGDNTPMIWTGNAASVSFDGDTGGLTKIVFTIGGSAPTPEPAGTVVEWNSSNLPSSGNANPFTKDGVTITCDLIQWNIKMFYADGEFTSSIGNFTQIEITADDCYMSGGGWSGSSSQKTWTGNAASVSFDGDIDGLTKIVFTIGGSAPTPSWVLDGDDWDYATKTLTVNNNLPANAYEDQTEIEHVIINNGVTSIGDRAFGGYTALKSIEVASGNTKYDSRGNCNAIIETASNTLIRGCKNTIIPNSVTSIGQGAFADCSGLTSITIPNSVTSIGYAAFYYCSGLTSVTIGNSVKSIGESAFDHCTGLTGELVIPNSVESIGYHAFDGCTGLTSITIPNSVTSIVEGAFFGCGLTSVTIPNSVTSIGTSVFAFCSSLSSIEIPSSVTSIGWYAFRSCTGLTSITIPSSVTSIAAEAFRWCTNITDVYCYPNAADLTWNEDGCDDFKDGGLTVCHVYAGQLSAYQAKFNGVVNVTFVGDLTLNITANQDPQNASVYYSTFFDSANKYALPAGVEAYVADLSGSDLVLTKIAEAGQVIPNDNAVILKAGAENISLIPTDATPVSFSATNDLEGVDAITAVTSIDGLTTENCYVLSGTNENGVGFYRINSNNLKAHKAYVKYSGTQNNAPRRMRFVFEQENTTTGMESIQPSAVSSQKVLRDGQLIIIRNGVEYNANGMMVK